MGTNYYITNKVCPTCGQAEDHLHIGKSSAGWCFHVRQYPNEGINTLDDWKKLFAEEGRVITDEYGDTVTAAEMIDKICNRGDPDYDFKTIPYGYKSWDGFHLDNQSEFGPNGLLRAKIGDFCTGHGEGTWDYIDREFS